MTSLFPFPSLSVPRPISLTFQLHLTLSTCLLPPPLQLQGVLMQLCYILSRSVPPDKERDPRQVRLGPASRPGPQPPGVRLRWRMVHRGIIVEILAKGK